MTPHTLAAIAAIAIPALVTISYIAACYTRPFRDCKRCKGTGRVSYWIGRGWHFCPRCNGTGLRLRTGRRIWNHIRRLQRDAAREDPSTTEKH